MQHLPVSLQPQSQPADVAQQASLTAQTILCGKWQLAFSMSWTTQVVESYVLSKIPRAPHWLTGCANIDGEVVPVVNMQAYLMPQQHHVHIGIAPPKDQRLLVGCASRQSADDTLAIGFSGLPIQVRYFRVPLENTHDLPPRLTNLCRGEAWCEDGRRFLEIDTQRLCDTLAQHTLHG